MKSYSTFIKIVSYCMAFLFLIAAVLQYNDPDTIGWTIIYAAAAIITFLFLSQKINWIVTAIVSVVALVACIFIGVDAMEEAGLIASSIDSWQMQNMAEEKAREAGGLLIIALWMIVMTFKIRGKDSA